MATYRSTLKRFNGSVWDVFYPRTNISQVDDLQSALDSKIASNLVYTRTQTDNLLSGKIDKRSGTVTNSGVTLDTAGLFPYAITSAASAIGLEYNILLNARRRGITVTQSGTGLLSEGQLDALFDGCMAPSYSVDGIDPNNPFVLLIEGLPGTHTQTGGMFGWTSRYWPVLRYKVEAYNSYGGAGWVTWIDQSTTSRTAKDLVIPIPSAAGGVGGGVFTKIKITIYEAGGSLGDNGFKRWGFSEIFFIHPEAMKVHQYLDVEWANRLRTARTIAGVSFDGSSNIAIPFANLSNKPTTLAGYGITDASPAGHNHDDRYYQQVPNMQNVVATSLFIGHSGSTTLGFGGKFKVLTKLVSGELEEKELQLPATPTFADIYVNNITGSDGAKGLVYFSRSSGASQLSFDFGHTHFETYSTTSTYYPNDVVFYSNRYYKRIGSGSTVGKIPTVTAYWSLLDLDNRYATAGHTHSQYLLTTGKAADSDKLNGLNLNSTTTNNEANKVMRTDGSGYAKFGWISTTSGNTSNAVSDVYVSIGDGWIYKKSLSLFKTELGSMPASDVSAWAKKSSLAIGDIPTGTTESTVALGNHTHDDRYVKIVDQRLVLLRFRSYNQNLTSTSSSIDLSTSLSAGMSLMIEVNSHSSYQYTPKIIQITLGGGSYNQLYNKATFTNYCAGTMEIYSFSVHYYQNQLTFSNIEKLVGTFNSSTKTIEWTTNSSAPLYVGRVWTV